MSLPRKGREESSAAPTQTLCLMCGCFLLLALTVNAGNDPSWWSAGSNHAVNPEYVTNAGVVTEVYPNTNAVATVGQIKQITARAVDELNGNLADGAGTSLNSMASNWASTYAASNYGPTNPDPHANAAVTVGQLKYVGNMVWNRLVTEGYTNAVPSWLATNSTDSAVAVVGQVESVFNFDLTKDSDGNGLPDWWEIEYFGHTMGNQATNSIDGNGLTLLQDFAQGNNPTNYYSQGGQIITPTVTIASGNSQTSPVGTIAVLPLAVKVVNSSGGALMNNAPVIFSADSQGGAVSATVGHFSATTTVRTGNDGQAQVYFRQPSTSGTTSQITAATGGQSVEFAESTGYSSLQPVAWFSAESGLCTNFDSGSGNTYVTKWRDRSSNGNDVTPVARGAHRPPTVGMDLNSLLPIVSFGSTAEYLSSANQLSSEDGGAIDNGITIIAVTQPVNSLGDEFVIIGDDESRAFGYAASSEGSLQAKTQFFTDEGLATSAAPIAESGLVINTVTYNSTSSTVNSTPGMTANFYANGTANGTVSGISASPVDPDLFIGGDDSFPPGTNIAEVLIFDQPLSDADRENVEGALADKYFIYTPNAQWPGAYSGALQTLIMENQWDRLQAESNIVLSPPAGVYTSPQLVTVTAALSSATIFYTTDGGDPLTEPNCPSIASGGSIMVSQTERLTMRAVIPNHPSGNLVTADYYIENQSPNLAAGWNHTVLLKNDGTVWTWGSNSNGQLGNSPAAPGVPTQVQATGFGTAVAVGAGDSNSFAIDSNGQLWAWGYNAEGELGDNTTTQRSSPVQIGAAQFTAKITAVAGASRHTIALDANGNVWAWGDNSYGQLGTGGTSPPPTQSLVPIPVVGLSNIVAIAAHGWHNLALDSSGNVWAWGDNTYGQIGNNQSEALQFAPVKVFDNTWLDQAEGEQVVSIACGTEHSLVATDRSLEHGFGVIWTWGANYNGQLGNRTMTQSTVPQPSDSPGIYVSANNDYAVAISASGSIAGWGRNDTGQLGSGCYQVYASSSAASDSMESIVMDAGASVSSCVAGGQHVAAVQSDGTVWGWGNTTGTGPSLGTALIPGVSALVSLEDSATAASARGMSSYVLLAGGTAESWGQNFNGNLGDGTTDETNSPTDLANLSDLTSLQGSVSFGLALDSNNKVYGWGLNSSGQLGSGTSIDAINSTPSQIATGATMIAAGYGDTLLVETNTSGSANSVWGMGAPAALGSTGSSPVTTLTQLSGLSDVQSVSVGQGFALALSEGVVYSVAGGAATTVTFGTSNPPIGSIFAVGQHAFAIDTNGNVWAWGHNAHGQLGLGSTTAVSTPTEIDASSFNGLPITKIAGDAYSTIALASDGSVWAWGDNTYYQLGDGTTTQHLSPNLASFPGRAIDVAMGYYHAAVVREDGTVVTWGTNIDGELGLGVSQIDGNARQVMGIGASGIAPTLTAPPAPPATVPMDQTLTIQPTATASTGHQIVKVIFYNEGAEIGEETAPFALQWTPPTWGDFHLNFVAVDDQGLQSTPLSSAYTIHVPYDSDDNGLPDWWEIQYFGQLGNDPNSLAPSGDGETLLYEYQHHHDPFDYYQGVAPTLSIVGSPTLSSASGQTLSLEVEVQNGTTPLSNAPVIFAVTSGSGTVSSSNPGTGPQFVQVTTDANGHATAVFTQPLQASSSSTITAQAGASNTVTFTATTLPDTNPPAAPINGVAVMGQAPGEIDMTWTNVADNATYIVIEKSTDNVNWTTEVTLQNATATSYAATDLDPTQSYYFRISAGN